MKHPFRRLWRSPGFTAVALLTLALGIGVNTSAFSVMNFLLFRGTPYEHPEQLVQILGTAPQWSNAPLSPAEFCALRDRTDAFESLSVFYLNPNKSVVRKGQVPECISELEVTPAFLHVLGLHPLVGRDLSEEDSAQHKTSIMLSHWYWKKNFQSDPRVVGQTLRFDGKDATIVGILPELLDDPMLWGDRIALIHDDLVDQNKNYFEGWWYQVAARLKPGVTIAQAQAQVAAVGQQLAHEFPKTNANRGLQVGVFAPNGAGDVVPTYVWLIMGLAIAVLSIACVNLANLQLVRMTARSRDLALQLALGAPRLRLISEPLQESFLLSIGGGVLGLLVARWINAFDFHSGEIALSIDAHVLSFTAAISILTALIFGTLPAFFALRQNINSVLKQGGRSATTDRARHRVRNLLVIVELALALTLLSGAGFFVDGIQRLIARSYGWNADQILDGDFELPHEPYGQRDDPRSGVFAKKFIAALERLPGVSHAIMYSGSPLSNFAAFDPIAPSNKPLAKANSPDIGRLMYVTPGFFSAYHIPILRGRDIRYSDDAHAPAVVLVNQALAEHFFPDGNAIGQHLRGGEGTDLPDVEIVGIVGNIVTGAEFVPGQPRMQLYGAWFQHPTRFISFAVDVQGAPGALGNSVRKALAEIEPDIAMASLQPASVTLEQFMSSFTFMRRVLAQFAGLGLVLALVGIYGVIANLTAERTQEIGVRMALGAQPRDVLWIFLRTGLWLALIGISVGAACAFALLRVLAHALALVPGNHPIMIAYIAPLLGGVALLACWLPARRALRVDPAIALRAE